MRKELKLGEIGKKKFKEVVKYLKNAGIYHKIDDNLIFLFAKLFEDFLKYDEKIQKEGAVVVSDKGNYYANPNYTYYKNALQNLKEIAKLLGIGAYARQKLGIESFEKKDEFMEFLKKQKKIREK